MILQSTPNHTTDTTQSVPTSPAELPVSPHTGVIHPSLEPEITPPPVVSDAFHEAPNRLATSNVLTTPEVAHPSSSPDAANSSTTPGDACSTVTSDVGNCSSVRDTQPFGARVITPTPTSAPASQSMPSSLTASCDDLWMTPPTLGEQWLDPTQPGATQRSPALPSEASPARSLVPDPQLVVPPPGYARLVHAPTVPSVSATDEETKTKICKMEKKY